MKKGRIKAEITKITKNKIFDFATLAQVFLKQVTRYYSFQHSKGAHKGQNGINNFTSSKQLQIISQSWPLKRPNGNPGFEQQQTISHSSHPSAAQHFLRTDC